jgi:hypothetical protein
MVITGGYPILSKLLVAGVLFAISGRPIPTSRSPAVEIAMKRRVCGGEMMAVTTGLPFKAEPADDRGAEGPSCHAVRALCVNFTGID